MRIFTLPTGQIGSAERTNLLNGGIFDQAFSQTAPTVNPALVADSLLFLAMFAQGLTYRPRSGTARTIRGVVDRDPPQTIEEPPGVMGKRITIIAANRATSTDDDDYGGIASSEVDTGGDRIDVPPRVGATAETRAIARVSDQDGGMIRVEVR